MKVNKERNKKEKGEKKEKREKKPQGICIFQLTEVFRQNPSQFLPNLINIFSSIFFINKRNNFFQRKREERILRERKPVGKPQIISVAIEISGTCFKR